MFTVHMSLKIYVNTVTAHVGTWIKSVLEKDFSKLGKSRGFANEIVKNKPVQDRHTFSFTDSKLSPLNLCCQMPWPLGLIYSFTSIQLANYKEYSTA